MATPTAKIHPTHTHTHTVRTGTYLPRRRSTIDLDGRTDEAADLRSDGFLDGPNNLTRVEYEVYLQSRVASNCIHYSFTYD